MILEGQVLLEWTVTLAMGVLSLSMVLVFVRLLLGPTLSDRVVALDMIGFLAIGFIAMYTLSARQPFFLDAAITLALVAFLATIAFARYVERTRPRRGP
jgi:multicomponent Na+:H+ antiporter subunit F